MMISITNDNDIILTNNNTFRLYPISYNYK